jgi:ribonuclease Y
LALGLGIGLYVLKPKLKTFEDYQRKSEQAVVDAEAQAIKIKEETRFRIQSYKTRSIETEEKLKDKFKRIEQLIISKEEQLQKKDHKKSEIAALYEQEAKMIEDLKQRNVQGRKDYIQHLLQKTGQTGEKIKEEILQLLQRDLELTREERLHKLEESLNEEKVRIAKNMVASAIQRYSNPTSVEKKSTVITLQRDETKGRLLGKKAENLLVLEELTGADIIFNDAPNTIIVSCFDLVKKHNTVEVINKLIKERLITPDKVRQKMKEVEAETERTLIRIGRDAIRNLEMENRNLPPDFARLIGRLKFRSSYGQNILKHSFEVGNFTVMLGGELGADLETCKVGGFLHDLGKAIDQEVTGSHDVLTKELMEKYGFSENEIHAAWTHHDAIPQKTVEALLVKAGDAISAGRPGARQESIEKYLERIRALEGIANSYEGVSKAFAISAGREVRVLVEPVRLQDQDLPELAKAIADEIQEKVGFPGKIKINVIRRTQNVDYAKSADGKSRTTLNKTKPQA